jgi:bacterioferritin (cytochrome b1)
MAETHSANTVNKILEVNLKDEKHAVDVYLGIMKKMHEMKDELKYEFFQLEHKIRHVITDEQEHITELKLLKGTKK